MATANATMQPAIWPGLDRLPEMGEEEFARWTALLRERTGMAMPQERKSFLVTSVGLRMRELGYQDYEAYYDFLTCGPGGNVEWTALVDRLTVHETRFFRDPRGLDLVREQALPAMTERIRQGGQVQIWSAGCSTGEEAFSLAMLMDDSCRKQDLPPRFGVIGTDISLYSLATAKEGMYPDRRHAQIPAEFRARYTEAMPAGGFRMIESLRRRICFAQFNILNASATPPGSMDLVYCQNVLIYFDRDVRMKILEGLVRPLRKGGLLVLGAGEMVGWKHPQMARTGNMDVLAYQRVTQ